ncbi:hypothetical protein BJF79_42825 [Actinomadura sp. CNU-125]|uniref:DUF4132 domain-containing protein n=1 Tax=Actinomadura sp. CNU-125 TaxID=1904961 RepID=UPI00095C3A11|nr:DUF4132 domain-containing protein [Actinomadura sp. CNU-125]OLT27103.1 hypothetical protein BJF79_42825 [Actinomadura sp. CNU-125]
MVQWGQPVERALLLAASAGIAPAQPPATPPPFPEWTDAAALPRPVLRDGGGEFPATAVRNLVLLLAMAGRPDDFPGVDGALGEVAAACEPASLAAFAWGLFEDWAAAGHPAVTGRHSHVLSALGRFGDADTVHRLAARAAGWTKPDTGDLLSGALRAMAQIGGDAAAAHLNDIAIRARTKTVRNVARFHLGRLAEADGLTTEQLADRLVPDLGLEASGTLALDYGPRRFTVVLDEQLVSFVHDEHGRVRKTLPKPGVKDDPERAGAARDRLARLRRDVRVVAADRTARLEAAMIDGRGWTPAEFDAHLVRHPIVRRFARRLVWRTADGTSFRIAEDGTHADASDETIVLAPGARIALPHPADLTDAELKAWADVFADYEILQPFPQLGRPRHVLTEDERRSDRLARLEGATAPAAGVRALLRTGNWRQSLAINGRRPWIAARVAGPSLVIDLAPGLPEYDSQDAADQTFRRVRLADSPYRDPDPADPPLRFGDLPAGAVSEAIAAIDSALRRPR